MKTVRKALQRIGWPEDQMSDKQITRELYRRWFACQREDLDGAGPVPVASVRGILVSMASEGNLDTLCWSDDDQIPEEDVVSDDERAIFRRETTEESYALPDRRTSKRKSTRDLVRWCVGDGGSDEATGWLVDRSEEGIAFIAPTSEAPLAGAEIVPCIHPQSGGVIEPGPAIVVRTEALNGALTLVCARLDEGSLPEWA